jgi:small subunit ribosomal protein S6
MAAEAKPLYEFMYVLDGVLSEDQIKELVASIAKFISENGGDIVETDDWGMRQLAYPIKKRKNGYYVVLHFNAPQDLAAKLDRSMRIEERVLRYMMLRLDAKMMRHFAGRHERAAKKAAAVEAAAE